MKGGKRKGSGRKLKYGEATRTVAFRVPISQIKKIKTMITLKLAQDLYVIRDRIAGNIIDWDLTYDEAKKTVAEFIVEDEKDGIFNPDFYEIVRQSELPEDQRERFKMK